MTTRKDDNHELDEFQEKLDQAKEKTDKRAEKTDDLTTRFRELRRQNHFRLMLEEVFHE
jgi:hypothetical protein